MRNKIEIPYFSKGLKYLTPALFLGGAYLMTTPNWVFGIIIVILAAIILTTKYVTTIDLYGKQYNDYLSLLGIAWNKSSEKFNAIEKIIVTKGNHAYSANTRSRSRQVNFSDYTGTLVFDQNRTLDLLTKNDKHELLVGVKPLAVFLKVEIEDCTTPNPYWIDLDKI